MIESIRVILAEHGRLMTPVADITDEQDLFRAGLTSFACVQLLLAIEDRFDVEIPDSSLNRRTFTSITTIASTLRSIAVLRQSA